jgi:hypothetical protein
MTIRYLSFDFDGCLFNSKYSEATHKNFTKHLGDDVLTYNKEFLNRIREENTQFDKAVAFVGSNRQSLDIDTGNCGGASKFKGSCFPAMKTITGFLGIEFDSLLLADITGDLEAGTSCELIMDEVLAGNWINMGDWMHQHAGCIPDEKKISLIFAQMQKAASDNPSEPIVFDFYDDRIDILDALKDYFTKFPHMLPQNITLRLNQYAGEEVALQSTLQGTGVPFLDYRTIVKSMLANPYQAEAIAEELKAKQEEMRKANMVEAKEKGELRESLENLLIDELLMDGLFVHDATEAKNFLKQNPGSLFVVRPSISKENGFTLITLVYETKLGIVNSRMGISEDGKLYHCHKDGKSPINILPEGFVETFSRFVSMSIRSINSAPNTEEMVYKPHQNSAQPESREKEIVVDTKPTRTGGFFEHKMSKTHHENNDKTHGIQL